jgi:hypothetical protein
MKPTVTEDYDKYYRFIEGQESLWAWDDRKVIISVAPHMHFGKDGWFTFNNWTS